MKINNADGREIANTLRVAHMKADFQLLMKLKSRYNSEIRLWFYSEEA
jgi:hypothetical protein